MNHPTIRSARKAPPATLALVATVLACWAAPRAQGVEAGQTRPNVLWLTIEDTSAYEFGCYGNQDAATPVIDGLAERGIRFDQARSTAPHCSPARATIISGRPATSWCTDWHRQAQPVPSGIYYLPKLLRKAGYFTSNHSKTDYNGTGFRAVRKDVWDAQGNKATYHDPRRKPSQPFFAVFNSMVTHLGRLRSMTLKGRRDFEGLDPEKLHLPPHVPDAEATRSDFAFHLEGVQDIDRWVGIFLDDLQSSGLADDTIVFFYSDHGGCLPRGKGYPFETGFRVPLIVHVPKRWQHLCGLPMGQPSDRLVGFEDLLPTVLKLAGVEIPARCEGRDFLGPDAEEKPYQFCFRTNHGKHFAPTRTVTDGHYKYIRAFIPHEPFGLWQEYQWGTPSHMAWHQMYHQGSLGKPHERHMLPGQSEYLFDLDADPWELHDLSNTPEHQHTLLKLRAAVAQNMRTTRDLGLFPQTLRRRPDGTPMARWIPESHFPVERLIEAAERASRADPTEKAAMITDLDDDLPSVRFWAACGLATLAQRGSLGTVPDALRRVATSGDENPDVVAKACCALAFTDEAGDALHLLVDMVATNKKGKGAEEAASALETLGPARIRPVLPRIEELGRNYLTRPLLCIFGKLDYGEAYGKKANQKGIKTNMNRRDWTKPNPRN